MDRKKFKLKQNVCRIIGIFYKLQQSLEISKNIDLKKKLTFLGMIVFFPDPLNAYGP